MFLCVLVQSVTRYLSTPAIKRQVPFAVGGCPPSKTSSTETFARKVYGHDRWPVKKGTDLFQLEQGRFVILTVCAGFFGCDRYVDG